MPQVTPLPLRRVCIGRSNWTRHYRPLPCISGDWDTIKPVAEMTAKEKDRYLDAVLRVWSRKESGHEGIGAVHLYNLKRAQETGLGFVLTESCNREGENS